MQARGPQKRECPVCPMVNPALHPKCDTLVDLAVTVYPIHAELDYEEWWQHTQLSESNTNGEQSWFNSPNKDTNFWAGMKWLDGQ